MRTLEIGANLFYRGMLRGADSSVSFRQSTNMRLLAWVAAVCCAAAASAAAPSATGVAAPDALAQGVGGSLDAHRHAHESGIRAMMRMMRESGTHPSAVSFVVGVGAHAG